ncbi:MAG: hypothetical protein PHS53_04010 [Candidatus Pacebacteria bacterium]|nr:hypothetical protein [Candidatus Paceibacterota bacterium]MDD5357283.1 hypothetical protein [Candidatus Paceibacterota bacterium]
MKILLINNGEVLSDKLQKALQIKHTVDVIDWKKDEVGDENKYDLIILAGGHADPVVGNDKMLKSEMDLIKRTKKPLLGISYGCELVAFVFGGHLEKLEPARKGNVDVNVVEPDPLFADCRHFKAFENERWVITDVSHDLQPLAFSSFGIEALKHVSRPIYGLQFDPEAFEEAASGEKILSNYFKILESSVA